MKKAITFSRYGAICASVLILALLGYANDAHSQGRKKKMPGNAEPNERAQFEQASVAVAPGSNCLLHPQGNQDPKESIHVNAEEDGVVRFLAVRPAQPNSPGRLALDCTDSNRRTKTYSVDLRSEATFAPHPFDPSRTNLAVRPALTGDPRQLTPEELVKGGYGLRPDPAQNPDAYQTWLTAANVTAHKLRTDRTLTGFPTSRQLDLNRSDQAPVLDAKPYKTPSSFWTGAILQGSYQKNATSALTYSYGAIFAQVVVPKVHPGPTTAMTIWDGLDNVCQAIIDVGTTKTAATFGIHHQCFDPHTKGSDTAGTRFTPKPGDLIFLEVWYCDGKGNLNLSGGYACTFMIDLTRASVWACDRANSSDCPSYKLDSADLVNGNLGFWADFIIENDSGQVVKGSQQWPVFSPVTMVGWASVIKGNGVSGDAKLVGTTTDPKVRWLVDDSKSNQHLRITLPDFAVKWSETKCAGTDKWDPNSGTCVSKN
jgi:hypothetical protein